MFAPMEKRICLRNVLCAISLLFLESAYAIPGLYFERSMRLGAEVGNGIGIAHSRSAPHASQTPCFTFEELWDMHKNFWDKFMYPNNVAEAKMINSTIFAENVIGRADLTRVFPGRELNTEYIFGLFTGASFNGGALEVIGIPLAYEIVHFAATDYITSSSVVVTGNHSSTLIPIEIDVFITWNSDKQITQYDATFRRFEWYMDLLFANVQKTIKAPDLTQTVKFMTQAVAQSVCKTHDTYCNGTNTQYESRDACMKFLTQDIRFGKAYELGRNTLLCRMVHQYMIAYRPSVHCPHLGPTGGDMCVDDKTYEEVVREKLYTNAPMVPRGEVNPSLAAQ